MQRLSQHKEKNLKASKTPIAITEYQAKVWFRTDLWGTLNTLHHLNTANLQTESSAMAWLWDIFGVRGQISQKKNSNENCGVHIQLVPSFSKYM